MRETTPAGPIGDQGPACDPGCAGEQGPTGREPDVHDELLTDAKAEESPSAGKPDDPVFGHVTARSLTLANAAGQKVATFAAMSDGAGLWLTRPGKPDREMVAIYNLEGQGPVIAMFDDPIKDGACTIALALDDKGLPFIQVANDGEFHQLDYGELVNLAKDKAKARNPVRKDGSSKRVLGVPPSPTFGHS